MRHDIIRFLQAEHLFVKGDIMEVLLVLLLLEVVDHCQFWWIILQKNLYRYGWKE